VPQVGSTSRSGTWSRNSAAAGRRVAVQDQVGDEVRRLDQRVTLAALRGQVLQQVADWPAGDRRGIAADRRVAKGGRFAGPPVDQCGARGRAACAGPQHRVVAAIGWTGGAPAAGRRGPATGRRFPGCGPPPHWRAAPDQRWDQAVVFGPHRDAGQVHPGGGDVLPVLPLGVAAGTIDVSARCYATCPATRCKRSPTSGHAASAATRTPTSRMGCLAPPGCTLRVAPTADPTDTPTPVAGTRWVPICGRGGAPVLSEVLLTRHSTKTTLDSRENALWSWIWPAFRPHCQKAISAGMLPGTTMCRAERGGCAPARLTRVAVFQAMLQVKALP
jgi:hypothetical protein